MNFNANGKIGGRAFKMSSIYMVAVIAGAGVHSVAAIAGMVYVTPGTVCSVNTIAGAGDMRASITGHMLSNIRNIFYSSSIIDSSVTRGAFRVRLRVDSETPFCLICVQGLSQRRL